MAFPSASHCSLVADVSVLLPGTPVGMRQCHCLLRTEGLSYCLRSTLTPPLTCPAAPQIRAFSVKVSSKIPANQFEGATTCASNRVLALLAAGSDVDARPEDDLESLVSE